MATLKRNFTEGPLFFRILLFALPIMATGILQVFYNMADSMIVGKFSGEQHALAAVGSTSALNALLVNLFLGVAVGAGIVVSQKFGANNYDDLSKATHTGLVFSLILGILIGLFGFIFAPTLLNIMKIREEYIHLSILYLRIIMCGTPASAVYNLGASVLRGTGDSKTPLIILSLSGLANVGLNLVFVILFNMSVDGVASATIISQYLSAISVLLVLRLRKNMPYALKFSKLTIHSELLKKMLRIGVPSGLQSAMFSISNVILMSAINTFTPIIVSAYSIAANIDGITYTSMTCFQQASMTFTGQNFGAKKNGRIRKSLYYSILQVTFVGILMANLELILAKPLASLYINANDPNKNLLIAQTASLMKVILTFYFLCGIMEVISGALRGLGCSITPMIISLIGICGLRMFWIYGIFFPSSTLNRIEELVLSFPLSWALTLIPLTTALIIFWKRFGILKTKQSPLADLETIESENQ